MHVLVDVRSRIHIANISSRQDQALSQPLWYLVAVSYHHYACKSVVLFSLEMGKVTQFLNLEVNQVLVLCRINAKNTISFWADDL